MYIYNYNIHIISQIGKTQRLIVKCQVVKLHKDKE